MIFFFLNFTFEYDTFWLTGHIILFPGQGPGVGWQILDLVNIIPVDARV